MTARASTSVKPRCGLDRILNVRMSQEGHKKKYMPVLLSNHAGILSLCGAKPHLLTFGNTLPLNYSLYDEPRSRFNFIEAVIFDNLSTVDSDSWSLIAQNVFNLIERSYAEPDSREDRIFFSTLNLDIGEVLNRIKRRDEEEMLD